MPMFVTTLNAVNSIAVRGLEGVVLAQTTTTSASWIDQLILVAMAGLAVFAVCRSTRRQ